MRRRPKAILVLISLRNEIEIQIVFKSVSKLESSGTGITTDLSPVLNKLRSSFLIKGKELRERGDVLMNPVKPMGAKLCLEIKKGANLNWEKYE